MSASSPDLRKNCACSATFFLDFRLHCRFQSVRDFNMRIPRAFFRDSIDSSLRNLERDTQNVYSRENMHITLFRRNRKERAVIFHVGIHFNGFAAIHAIQYANDASRPTGASIIKRPILAIRSYITGVLLQSNLNF